MRLPIVISTGLVMFLSLNAPVMSQPLIRVAQSQEIAEFNSKELRVNQRLWNQQKISNYRYTLTNSCFCTEEARGPVVIEVRDGKTTNITIAATGQKVNPELFQKYNTIPKLFRLLKDARSRKASSITVQYDASLGYPTQINIDYSSQIADEEVYLTVDNLEEIQ